MERIINFRYGDLQLVESGKLFGNMSNNPMYFQPGIDTHVINGQVMANRMNFAIRYGVHGTNMFNTDTSKENTVFNITPDYLLEKEKGMVQIPADILIVTSETPDVIIGSYTEDLPVIMAYDKEYKILIAKAITNDSNIDDVPGLLVDILHDRFNSSTEEIVGLIGPSSIYPEHYIDQFEERGVSIIKASEFDPLHSKYFFHGEGCNFSGGFIMSDNNITRAKTKSLDFKAR